MEKKKKNKNKKQSKKNIPNNQTIKQKTGFQSNTQNINKDQKSFKEKCIPGHADPLSYDKTKIIKSKWKKAFVKYIWQMKHSFLAFFV